MVLGFIQAKSVPRGGFDDHRHHERLAAPAVGEHAVGEVGRDLGSALPVADLVKAVPQSRGERLLRRVGRAVVRLQEHHPQRSAGEEGREGA